MLPEARIAILRTVLYLFVIVDINLIVRDPIPLSRHPELYRPLAAGAGAAPAAAQRPADGRPCTSWCWSAALVAAANRLPRLAGWVVAAAFTWWTAIGMSYGKVDHDHLALVVALVGAAHGRAW